MFPIILITACVVLLALSTYGMVVGDRGNNLGIGIPAFAGGFVAFIALIVVAITWPCVYFTSVGGVTKMEAFYYDTLAAYEYTVAETGTIEITNAEAGLVDVAYDQQGVATSERLRELRDKIEWFNARLRHYGRLNSMFIADPFLADLPSGLAPITLGINTGGAR